MRRYIEIIVSPINFCLPKALKEICQFMDVLFLFWSMMVDLFLKNQAS